MISCRCFTKFEFTSKTQTRKDVCSVKRLEEECASRKRQLPRSVFTQFVKNHNAKTLKILFSRSVEVIIERHNVDDYVDSLNNCKEGIKIVEQVSHIHDHGEFFIRGFVSNESRIITHVQHDVSNCVK